MLSPRARDPAVKKKDLLFVILNLVPNEETGAQTNPTICKVKSFFLNYEQEETSRA